MRTPIVFQLIDDLGRTFIEIGKDGEHDPETASMIARMTGQKIGWADVLAHSRAVLLGEAGTGKTAEFRLHRERRRRMDAPMTGRPYHPLAQCFALSCRV